MSVAGVEEENTAIKLSPLLSVNTNGISCKFFVEDTITLGLTCPFAI